MADRLDRLAVWFWRAVMAWHGRQREVARCRFWNAESRLYRRQAARMRERAPF